VSRSGHAKYIAGLASLVLTVLGTAWAKKRPGFSANVTCIYVEDSGHDASEQASNEARHIIAGKECKTCFILASSPESADGILRVREEPVSATAVQTTTVVPGGSAVTTVTSMVPKATRVSLSLYSKALECVVWEDAITVRNRSLAPRELLPKLARQAHCKQRHHTHANE
jgi:hypothetical protein